MIALNMWAFLVCTGGKEKVWEVNRQKKMYGSRALTKQENRDEIAARQISTARSKNPHMERREADLILNRASHESGTNIDKALNRFASENDLKHAVKRGYISPPNKNIEEMSSKEINDHLDSNPSIREHLVKDYERSVKRGKALAAAVLLTYATVKIASVVLDNKTQKNAMEAMFNAALTLPHP